MRIIKNGTEHQVAENAPLGDLLPEDRQGIAVAVNDAIVPRHEIASVRLADGDRVEIVTAVQGG